MCCNFPRVNSREIFGNKKSIIVYKVYCVKRGKLISPFQRTKVNGPVVKSDRKFRQLQYYEIGGITVDHGLHAFLSPGDLYDSIRNIVSVGRGTNLKVYPMIAHRKDYVAHGNDDWDRKEAVFMKLRFQKKGGKYVTLRRF